MVKMISPLHQNEIDKVGTMEFANTSRRAQNLNSFQYDLSYSAYKIEEVSEHLVDTTHNIEQLSTATSFYRGCAGNATGNVFVHVYVPSRCIVLDNNIAF